MIRNAETAYTWSGEKNKSTRLIICPIAWVVFEELITFVNYCSRGMRCLFEIWFSALVYGVTKINIGK